MFIRVAVGLVAALCAVGLLIVGGWAIWCLIGFAAILTIHEIHSALKVSDLYAKLPAYAFAALFVPVRVLLGDLYVYILLLLCLLAMFVALVFFRADKGRFPVDELLRGGFAFIYPLAFLYCFLLSASFEGPFGIAAFLTATVCPLLCDAFAMFGGKLFGKRKLIPELSPNKTVEGSACGFAGGVLGGLALYFLQPLWGGMVIDLRTFLALGFVLSAAGQLGDLFASAIKRHCCIKDFGKLLPGHGGILDRIDSVLFCAPVVYICFVLLII